MSTTIEDITYDYSDLNVNGITPSAVYANETEIFRLKANGKDYIHKDVVTTTSYSGDVTVGLEYKVVISGISFGSDCSGSYSTGTARVTITPLVYSTSGDVIEATVTRVIVNQRIVLAIGTSGDTHTISAGTDITNGTSFTIDWTYNYGVNTLYQVNSGDDEPFVLSASATFDTTASVYDSFGNFLTAGGTTDTADSVIIDYIGRNGTYYYLPRYTHRANTAHTENYREY